LAWAVGSGALLLVAIVAIAFSVFRGASTTSAPTASAVKQSPPTAELAPAPPIPESPPRAEDSPPAAPTATPAPLPLATADDKLPAPFVAAAEVAPGPVLKLPAAFPKNVANRPVPRIGDQPWLISEPWRAQHERQLRALNRATTKLIFLGDSITEGWSVSPAYRERFGKYSPLNLGITSDTTQNVLWRLEHGAIQGTNPRVIVLMIGINNLAGGFTAEQTADGVRAVLASIRAHAPSARVVLLALLPARQEASHPLREAIKHANQLLAGLAVPGRVDFHDLGAVMLEADGSISKSTMHDFLHPTPDGFARVSSALAPILDGLLAG
jgi:beta-glucosidase